MSFQTVIHNMKGLRTEADPEFDAAMADPRVRQAVEAAQRTAQAEASGQGEERTEALRQDLGIAQDLKARFKIELTYGPNRTVKGPNAVGVTVWESGKKLHGGGDELAFFCLDSREGEKGGCGAVIIGGNVNGDVAYCPHCQRTVKAEYLTNMLVGNLTSQQLARNLEKLFHQLSGNADIYIKYHDSDPRYRAMLQAKGKQVARRLRGLHIYPLKNILKDTSNGAEVGKRFYAFITS